MSPLQTLFQTSRQSAPNRAILERAFAMAEKAHRYQKRLSGDPYITHPIAVAQFLAELNMDTPTIAAALLHDTVEDTPITLDDIRREFGDEIAFLVDGVTKLEAIQYHRNPNLKTTIDPKVNSLKKMFFAMAEDIRVILIKLADRHHNMETLKYIDPEGQKRIAHETLEIYAPIAARLGMGNLKGQLEDLAFPYILPTEYRSLVRSVRTTYEDRIRYIERTKPIIERRLKDADIHVLNAHSRAKRYWSLYQKLQRYDMNLEKIMDLVAMRIIVPDIKSCYEALGIIHTFYRPLPGRIKDYIAIPKPNGYRSLHTTVFCEKGRIAEIQIRTPEMHDHAENGIAAHWAYSETGKRKAIIAEQQETRWVNQLKKFLSDIKSSQGIQNLKIDFFKNRIFAFTPNGDIKDLPEGATPVDFAYAVHSGLGNLAAGAKVNGKLVTLTTKLKNGDVVEIMKNKSAHPSADWMRSVKTAEARKRIRNWIRTKTPVLVHEVNKKETPKPPRIARSKSTLSQIKTPLIEGQAGILYKLGKCCNPTSDQTICGYITRTKGVTIHLASCKNIKSADMQRLIDAKWE